MIFSLITVVCFTSRSGGRNYVLIRRFSVVFMAISSNFEHVMSLICFTLSFIHHIPSVVIWLLTLIHVSLV